MANTWANSLYKLRFIIVTTAVMALLSTPFMTEAEARNSSSAEVLFAPNSISGMSSEFTIQGEGFLEVAITKPSGSQILLTTMSEGSGTADLSVADYHLREAGTYTIEARNLNKNEGYGEVSHFEVYPGEVSSQSSKVRTEKRSLAIGETITLSVELMDQYENPIDKHLLSIISSNENISTYSKDVFTNERGKMEFHLTGEKNGITDITIFDRSTNTSINNKTRLAVTQDSYQAFGGYEPLYSNVELAAESGPVAGFEISNLSGNIAAGNNISAAITAVDSSGNTVQDYTGTVRFSSSDGASKLPNDYTFTASDLGEHNFSLAFKFVSPGKQSLSVTDSDQFSIKGEVDFTVVIESKIEYGNDFVSADYVRQGDFKLINPGSGTYSSSTLDIQGEAEYGNFAIIMINDEEVARVEVAVDDSFEYSVQDLEDGEHEVYVDIVELGDGEIEDAEILQVLETSDVEKINIDTSAPELVSITSDPTGNIDQRDVVKIIVLTEPNLEEISILFEDEIYEMTEANTSGKYETEILAPSTEGTYGMDVILLDTLGNEVQYRDAFEITVGDQVAKTEITNVNGLTATSGDKSIILSWEAAESEDPIAYYRIKYGPSPASLFAVSDTFDSATSWTISGLKAGENHFFTVNAITTKGDSGPVSDSVLGVPIGQKIIEADENIPNTASISPVITNTNLPNSTPDSGPNTYAFILISLLAAAFLERVNSRHGIL